MSVKQENVTIQSEDEAYLMMDGVNAVMRALSEAGFSPR